MARKTAAKKKELAENIFWKMENEGFEYWAVHYCNPDRAPDQKTAKIMSAISKKANELEALRSELIAELRKHSKELADY